MDLVWGLHATGYFFTNRTVELFLDGLNANMLLKFGRQVCFCVYALDHDSKFPTCIKCPPYSAFPCNLQNGTLSRNPNPRLHPFLQKFIFCFLLQEKEDKNHHHLLPLAPLLLFFDVMASFYFLFSLENGKRGRRKEKWRRGLLPPDPLRLHF